MSNLSIQGLPSVQSLNFSTVSESESNKYALEMNRAAEAGDVHQIAELVRQGANPNQEIPHSPAVAVYLVMGFVHDQLNCEDFRERFAHPSEEVLEGLEAHPNPLLSSIIERLSAGEEVPDAELYAYSATTLVKEGFMASPELYDEVITPLIMVLNAGDFDVARELIELGADVNHPTFVNALECLATNRHCFKIIHFLQDQGLAEGPLTSLKGLRGIYELETGFPSLCEELQLKVDIDLEQFFSERDEDINDYLFETENNNQTPASLEVLNHKV